MSGLDLRTNVPAQNALRNVDARVSSLRDDLTQLSSGLRITSAADDPSGLAIAETLHGRVQGYRIASDNVQTARNATVVADSALGTIGDILQRIRTLAVQAASDVTSSTDRANIQIEVNQLIDEIDSTVRNTSFNGNQLIQRTGQSLGVNDGGTEGVRVLLALPNESSALLGVASVDVGTFATAETSIGQLDGALDQLLQQRAQLGAQIVSLEEDAQAGSIAAVGITQSESAIRDAHLGSVATDYARNQILLQAGSAVLAQASATGNLALTLFNQSALPQQPLVQQNVQVQAPAPQQQQPAQSSQAQAPQSAPSSASNQAALR